MAPAVDIRDNPTLAGVREGNVSLCGPTDPPTVPVLSNVPDLEELRLAVRDDADALRRLSTAPKLRKLEWHPQGEKSFHDSAPLVLAPEIGLLSRVEELVIWSNAPKVLPSTIGEMRSLRSLRIEGRLQPLPDELFALPALEVLILYLDGEYVLQEGLGRLTTLRHLDVRSDSLLTAGAWLGHLVNLEELHLWPRCIELPPEIGTLTKLRTVYANVHRFPPELAACPLEYLNWEFMTIDDEKRSLLSKLTTLRELRTTKSEARTIKPHLPPGTWRKKVRGRVAHLVRAD